VEDNYHKKKVIWRSR